MTTEEKRIELVALFEEFWQESRARREQYARNEKLYLEQAMGRPSTRSHPRTGTPVLYATYRQELADAVELMPEAVFLARRGQDEQRADNLTRLHRALLERMDFADVYRSVCENRARLGVGYTEITVKDGENKVVSFDPRAILTDPMTEDLQEGRAVFKISYHPMEYFRAHYPKAYRRMKPENPACMENADGKRIALITAYYKTFEKGKSRVHEMKMAGGAVLYHSVSEHPEGVCAHGEYPIVAWYYDRLPGTPWGFGAFDYLAPVQSYIDKVDTLVMQNLARSAKPRLMVNRAAGLDLEALRDEEQEVILADRIDESAIRWQECAPMAPYAVQMLLQKCDMLKTESGQNAASRGEMPSNATSGTAISMLQAAGSKRTNLHQAAINQAFLKMVRQIVSNLAACGTKDVFFRTEEGYQVLKTADALGDWEYDLQVRLQRMPQYESVYQNQLLMQLVQMGTLSPETGFALMDLSNKEAILKGIRKGVNTDGKSNESGDDESRKREGTT